MNKPNQEVIMKITIAKNIDDIDLSLVIRPLNKDNYDDYYVVTRDGRGEDPTAILIRKFLKLKNKNLEQNLKILFSGFPGCGKSTELFKLKQELDGDFLVRTFSVLDKLDPNNLSISEILITIMGDLFEFVNDNYKKMTLSKKLLENIENWTASIYDEKTTYKYFTGNISAGGNVEAGFGKILNIFARLGLDFNAGRKFQQIIKKDSSPNLTELILNCNLLIMEIKKQLPEIGKHNIIFIIEDLEKIDRKLAEEIFFTYSKQLTAIDCCFIFTFPISLVYNPKSNVIARDFDENFTLPMIKVHEKDNTDFEAGINSILAIINKRIAPDKNIIPRDLLVKFIRMSGGCLRDLFRMLKMAAENAVDHGKTTIEEDDFQYSLKRLKTDYANSLSYDEESKLTTRDYYNILANCCHSADKKPEDVKGLMDLKHNCCILGYNGDGWFDVHPVVKEILRDKEVIV
ncbi:MAG: hypothetical protein QG657_1883 [Acidobacteriota bacterium]|nr:hypothetical protein [Acidobacteriota bacterium]